MNEILILLFLLLSSFFYKSQLEARPVSYGGGWTLMQNNDASRNSLHMYYSPSYKYSIGYKSEYLRHDNIALNSMQLNNLIKRWNFPAAQGNIYFKSNIGNAHKSQDNEIYASIGMAADFETRKYFISYENKYYKSNENVLDNFEQSFRVGVAPYVAEYGNLHSWIMLQLDHAPDADSDKIITTALIRLFKGINLLEIGISSNERLLFNLIKRF